MYCKLNHFFIILNTQNHSLIPSDSKLAELLPEHGQWCYYFFNSTLKLDHQKIVFTKHSILANQTVYGNLILDTDWTHFMIPNTK